MIRIYGSPHCPDCVACKAAFDEKGTPYEFIDITGSMPNLKAFLKMRDHLPLFEEVKERGSVGIPAIEKEDGTITLDWEEVLKEYGMTAQPGKACSLDGKGC
ncbi:glutaredoxin [Erysipelotrichaceae bacterium Oil+RF-744-GAM-WT-6]|jgi:glutaredoxin-related protein|uniref:Glutaredoxin n=1 Tax=Stecheria intestinalis TaxID=2606630 RepID=A0A7X2TH09_9FIRM|nr:MULTISPECIES: glutaredoxin domain-containing protein [Erysipelotrichaceae]MCI2154297.1 glutaredoxin [Solobacterium sp.]MDY3235073.1 glutaredoxin domain-containing protein [Erysipelotrichaceae bacterium]MDY4680570.1 glutaredoxin domain-containing protein [Lachnospiraceae bacterium]MDD5881188.1 glutaredoxin domain-containing protein [Stecheria intestinalis]MDD6365487.1 glutaredoxin domain-containing protein [Stecheria intestinalis]